MSDTETRYEVVASAMHDVQNAVHYGVKGERCLKVLFCHPLDLTIEKANAIIEERLNVESEVGSRMEGVRR